MGVGGQCLGPATLTLGKTAGTHCTGGWMGPRASGWVWKILPPPGFNPQTIQTVASQYTDYTILTHSYLTSPVEKQDFQHPHPEINERGNHKWCNL